MLTVFTSLCVPQSIVKVQVDEQDDPKVIDVWKGKYPDTRILHVGQCIRVLCVTVLYSVCRCGSVHVGLYNVVVHTFCICWSLGRWVVGSGVCMHV